MPSLIDAEILANEMLSPEYGQLVLRASPIATARPGQFVELRIDDSNEPFIRRPFSIFSTDEAAGTFCVIYLVRGSFTHRLSQQPVGRRVSVIGPLGNGFTVDPAHRQHLLVGGGIGIPPLYALASRLITASGRTDGIRLINGARRSDLLVACDRINLLGIRQTVMTDDGSSGTAGSVLDGMISDIHLNGHPDIVYACGPTPMLRAVSDHCNQLGLPCQVCLETVMMCGVGVCMGCVVKVRAATTGSKYEYVRTCMEGPVLPSSRIIWE